VIVIIAGSRTIKDPRLLRRAIQASKFKVTAVISGDAPGVDRMAIEYAGAKDIPCTIMPALWDDYGYSAGTLRNESMAMVCKHYMGGLIAIWDGKSPGTRRMIEVAEKYRLKIYVHRTDRR
jgi:hypothetical protein